MTNWLARYATRVAVRRVVTILVLSLLAWVGIGRAEAQSKTISEAYAECVAWSTGNPGVTVFCEHRPSYSQFRTVAGGSSVYFGYGQACPSGSNWDHDAGSCTTECGSDGWPDPNNPGQCLNEEKCLAKPNLGASSTGGGFSTCSGGCRYEPLSAVSVSFGGSQPFSYGGSWHPTGEACAAGDPAPEPIPPEGVCTPLGNGQTACKKPDGRNCYTTPSGKQFCWQPGETGEKTDGPDLQKNVAGPDAIPPDPVLPSGDSLIQDGESVTTSESTPGGRTTTTTTTNYSTQHGTNAGPGPGQAEGGGGTGSGGGDGDGDGDDDKGSVSGGGDCSAPPTVTGGDPLLAEQIRQQWLTRCGDGTDPSAEEGDYLGSGEGEPEPGSLMREFDGDVEFDQSGFGYARTCPALPTINVLGQQLSFETSVFCDWMHLGGWFVVLLTGLACARHLLEA